MLALTWIYYSPYNEPLDSRAIIRESDSATHSQSAVTEKYLNSYDASRCRAAAVIAFCRFTSSTHSGTTCKRSRCRI